MAADDPLEDLGMDPSALYQEEVFTDRRVGTIMRLTPVTADGSRDDTRPVVYVGQTQILTPGGALPLSFEIQASSLAEAASAFGDAARNAVNETMERLKELRREAATSLVLPGSSPDLGGFGGPGGGFPGGGMPGGGKIQLP